MGCRVNYAVWEGAQCIKLWTVGEVFEGGVFIYYMDSGNRYVGQYSHIGWQ